MHIVQSARSLKYIARDAWNRTVPQHVVLWKQTNKQSEKYSKRVTIMT